MKSAVLALLAIVLILALRHREPDRAVMRPWHEPEDGIQPADPYPASLPR